MHLSPQWLRLLSVLWRWFCFSSLFVYCFTPILEVCIVLCFVVRYLMSILVLQSSWWGRESWLLCLICLPGVSWWLSGSSSRCHGVVCGLWLWYFLIILTYFFRCFQEEGLINQLHHKNSISPCLWCCNLAKIEGTLVVGKFSLIGFDFHLASLKGRWLAMDRS